MVRSYVVEGKEVGWHTAGEAAEVLLFSTLALVSGSKAVSAIGKKVCFTGDTLVETSTGKARIDEVREGDYVLSENPETGEKDYKKVVRTFVNESNQLVKVKTQEEEIEATPEHPFYVEGIGFVSARKLKAGDVLRKGDGSTVQVEAVELENLDEAETVYNMEVEDYHTYFVGNGNVLVHNNCNFLVGGNEGTPTNKNIEVTDSVIKDAMEDAPLLTQQGSVSKPVIQNYVERINAGETNIPPIKVDGNIIIDGNHRYIASRITGVEVEVIPWRGGNPNKVISWLDMILDDFDWGNR